VGGESTFLDGLETADLHALRLAAQVMRHKAEVDDRPLVADYFASLDSIATSELALHGEALRVLPAPTVLGLAPSADAEDRRVLGEYLTLLVANERLPQAVRDLSRRLRARDCR